MNWLTEKYQAVKNWFWNSESIFLARLETATGFTLAVLQSVDWHTLLSQDFSKGLTWNNGVALGLAMVAKGVISELARRRNTAAVEVNGQDRLATIVGDAAEVKVKDEDIVIVKTK